MPFVVVTSWDENDVVEVYEYDSWWVGKIIRHLPCETKYVVYFLKSSKEMQFDASMSIRSHQDWVQSMMHTILLGNYTLFT
ncbi:unnamed protein product [Sphagnum balticum]